MAGDGVSLPTTIAQLGSVARTQAKGQQTAHPAAPFADQLEKKDELKVQHIKEIQKAEQQKIDPDKEKDKRRRNRMRRKQKLLARKNAEEPAEGNGEDQDGQTPEQVGVLIDLWV